MRRVYVARMALIEITDAFTQDNFKRAIDPAKVTYAHFLVNPFGANGPQTKYHVMIRVEGQDLLFEYGTHEAAERVYNMLVTGWAGEYTAARTTALASREQSA